MLWRLWPILLVAVGIEIILRRRHLWVSILIVLLIIGALVGVLWYSGMIAPRGEILSTTKVSQIIGAIETAEVEINSAVGDLNVNQSLDSSTLINGEVNLGGGLKVFTNYQAKEDMGYYSINSRPFNTFLSSGSWNWDLGLTSKIPLQLNVSMGAGDMDLDLTGMIITGLEVSQGVGDITITISNKEDCEIEVQQAVGSIMFIMPEDLGIRLQVNRAITNLDLPAGYDRDGDYYYSPGYETMENQVDLQISQAIGNISIQN